MKRYISPEAEWLALQAQAILTVSLELDDDEDDTDVTLPFVPFG